MNRDELKSRLLACPITREILFFLFQKKVYKGRVDQKIKKLFAGKSCLSGRRIHGLVVSMTSFPARMGEIKYALFSLVIQSMLPERIVLWLAESQFPLKDADPLLSELEGFKQFGLEIRWCEDIKSYKKLVPALEAYPGYYIVTVDDDVFYRRRWLEKIWETHVKHPDDVICHKANRVRFDGGGKTAPYQSWQWDIRPKDASQAYFPVGVGGVLYHREYLYRDVADRNLFMRLAPCADDIWFYFMTVLNGRKIRVVKMPYAGQKYVNPYHEYNLVDSYKLSSINIEAAGNDEQFTKTIEYYKDKPEFVEYRRERKKVLFISSTGGHLFELLELKDIFDKYDYHIITEKTPMTAALKNEYKERISYLSFVTKKNRLRYLSGFIFNCICSLRLFLNIRPGFVVTTGSNTAVPMCFIGKLFGAKIIWIVTRAAFKESITSPKAVYPIADLFVIQNKELQRLYPNAVLCQFSH